MSVISKVLNGHTVKREICQCQRKHKSARKLKKHLRKQEPYFSKWIWTGLCSDTLIFPLDNCKPFFFLIKKPTNDQVHFLLCKLVYGFTLLRRAMLKNQVWVFIASFPTSKNNLLWKREMRGSKLNVFQISACNPTTYILKNPVYAKLKIQDSL